MYRHININTNANYTIYTVRTISITTEKQKQSYETPVFDDDELPF